MHVCNFWCPGASHSSAALRRDDEADRQGKNRLARGMNFYQSSRQVAASESSDFPWQLIVVPGIAHSHHDVAPVAAPLLLGEPSPSNG